jgi:predicted dehydrogenase
VRNFAQLGALAAVCDEDPAVAQKFASQFGVPARSFADILADKACVAVAIATPAALHSEHVMAALAAQKHVFVEKPVALSMNEGRALERAAKGSARVLMVGHLLQYHPVFIALLDLVRAGRLGRVQYAISNRLSFGKVRTEEDVIWSFAPHDISMMLAIMGGPPIDVAVAATAAIDPAVYDIADIHLRFAGGAAGRISASWLHPFKEHKLVVTGEFAHAVFDDRLPWAERLVVYDHRIDRQSGRRVAVAAEPVALPVEEREPLGEECMHFLDSIAAGAPPRTGPTEALGVLAVLEAASRSARTGARISLAE